MKNVLIISSSLRGGSNSEILAQASMMIYGFGYLVPKMKREEKR